MKKGYETPEFEILEVIPRYDIMNIDLGISFGDLGDDGGEEDFKDENQ